MSAVGGDTPVREAIRIARPMLSSTSAPVEAPQLELPALATGASDPAVQITLSVASGMIGDQRLEHFGEPRGEPLGSDTLGSDAGAFPYQEDFVGETLGIGQPGIAAQAN